MGASSISVDDDLSTSQTGIASRSADNESASWINEDIEVIIESELFSDFLHDLLGNELTEFLHVGFWVVLDGHEDGVDTWVAMIRVIDSDL